LLILLAGAAALRLLLLDTRELFRDEAASWLLARSAWGEIISRSSSEPYAPLYPFVLKAWIGVLGDAEATLRALSGLAGVAVVGVTWAWTRQAIGSRAALVAAALAVAGELWMLPTGVAVFGLQATVVAILAVRRQAGTRAAGIALAIGLVAFLPWIPRMLSVAGGSQPFWTPAPDLAALLQTVGVAFGGSHPSPGWAAVPPLAVLAVLGFRALFRRGFADPTALTVSAGAVLIVAWWVASLWRPAYDSRYLGAAVPPLAMAIAAGAESLVARLQRSGWTPRMVGAAAGVVLILVGAGTAVYEADWVSGEGQSPAYAASILLQERVQPGDIVLAPDALSYFPLAYLLERDWKPIELPAPLRYWRSGREPAYSGGDLIPADATIEPDVGLEPGALPGLAAGGSIWLVALTDPEAEVRGFAPLADGRVVEKERLAVSDHGDPGLIVRLRPAP
jgi:hypothetical protein